MKVTFYFWLVGNFMVYISYPLILFYVIKNSPSSMAPKSLPVINSFRLQNHKTGLNCWSIRANWLPTSKEEQEKCGQSQKQRQCQQIHLWRLWAVAWRSRAKLWPQNCCLRLSWWGESIPQSLPAADTESLFTFRFLKLLPGSGWGQTPQWCIEELVWEFLSHLRHIPETWRRGSCKNCLMRRRWYCSFSFRTFIIFVFFSWRIMFYEHELAIALTIFCPLQIRTFSSTLMLHFPALGERSSKSTPRTLASLLPQAVRRSRAWLWMSRHVCGLGGDTA